MHRQERNQSEEVRHRGQRIWLCRSGVEDRDTEKDSQRRSNQERELQSRKQVVARGVEVVQPLHPREPGFEQRAVPR